MTTLADILGGEGAAGSPGQLRNVASKLDEVSDTAAHIESGLSRLDAGSWTGEASNRYREKQNAELPPELGKLRGSFHLASRYVAIYAGDLERIQDEGRALARKRETAEAALQAAQNKESVARKGVTQAKAARIRAADPASAAHADTAVANANQAASAATAARQRAAGSVSQIDAEAAALRARLRASADRASQGLVDASHQGIRNNLFSNIEHFKDTNPIGQALIAPVVDFVARSIDLGKAAYHFVDDPSFENLDKVAEAYTKWVDAAKPIIDAIAIAAMVAIAVVLISGTGGAAFPVLLAVTNVSTWVNRGLDASKMGADAYLVGRGRRSPVVLFEDGVDMGIDLIPSGGRLNKTGELVQVGLLDPAKREFVRDYGPDLAKAVAKEGLDQFVWPQLEATVGQPGTSTTPVIGPGTGLTDGSSAQLRLKVSPVPVQMPTLTVSPTP